MLAAVALLRESEVAAQLGLSARTVRKLRAAGDIEYILIGRTIRYSVDDINRFIADRKTKCASIKGPKARIGGMISRSNVIAFENLRES
jgi:excisionase family DNA binding protein